MPVTVPGIGMQEAIPWKGPEWGMGPLTMVSTLCISEQGERGSGREDISEG